MSPIKNFKENSWLQFTFGGCIVVLFYVLLVNIGTILGWFGTLWAMIAPVIVGIVVAYLINPIVTFFEKKVFSGMTNRKTAWSLSLVISIVLVIAVVAGLIIAVVPPTISSASTLINNFGFYINTLVTRLDKISISVGQNGIDLEKISKTITDGLQSLVGIVKSDNIIEQTQQIGGSFVSFLIGCIFAIYFLAAKERLALLARKMVEKLAKKEERAEKFIAYCSRCHVILLRYISCSVLEAIFVGAANAIFMLICGMRYIPLISVVVALTNLAPTFGPIIGCVFGMFILVLFKPSWAIAFLIFTIVLQTVDGYIVKPKLFGNTLGVSPILILVFIVLGGRIFGIPGILLAIPLAAIAHFTVTERYVSFRPVSRVREEFKKDEPGNPVRTLKRKRFSGRVSEIVKEEKKE